MTDLSTAKNYDLLVIGSGSAGSTVAIEAGALGISCAVFDQRDIGGTCVHRGCVPKKLLWHAADIIHQLESADAFGVHLAAQTNDKAEIDYPLLHKRSKQHIERINQWFRREFERANVDLIEHPAALADDHTVVADGVSYRAQHIVIASGSQPVRPTLPGAELAITSDEFFELEQLPSRVAIVGSGYIAVELAGVLNAFGAQATLVARRDNLSHQFDAQMAREMADRLIAQGVQIQWQHQTSSIERVDGHLQLNFNDHPPLACDCVLWATGREANLSALNLDNTNVVLNQKGFIQTDIDQRSSVEHIYALGDVAGRELLTPVAIRAARYLVRRLYCKEFVHFDYHQIPSVVFCHPPYARTGLSEEQARQEYGDDVHVYFNHFTPLSEALGKKQQAVIKLITQASTDRVLGLHIIAPAADEILQGFAVAISMGASKADFDRCVAIHPTNAEEIVTLR